MTPMIPARLRKDAYASLRGELAWPRERALEVIEWATDSHIAVLGAEVWLPTMPGPTIPSPFIYTLATEPGRGEPWTTFMERANRAARDYVECFEWDERDVGHQHCVPYFNLMLEDRDWRMSSDVGGSQSRKPYYRPTSTFAQNGL